MFTLFYHHYVREMTGLYSNKWIGMENEKGELSVIDIQTLISNNNVVQWLLISFRTKYALFSHTDYSLYFDFHYLLVLIYSGWLVIQACQEYTIYKIGPSITVGFQKCSLFLSYATAESSRHLSTHYSNYLAVPL